MSRLRLCAMGGREGRVTLYVGHRRHADALATLPISDRSGDLAAVIGPAVSRRWLGNGA